MTPSKIDWCDETVNPLGWGCWGPGGTPEEPKPCWYCYAKRMAKGPYAPHCERCRQFIPHWHEGSLERPRHWKKGRKIFWQSMGDLFHPCTEEWQIEAVLEVVKATPQHTHIFCTKNPARYAEFNPWPENCWLGVTATDSTSFALNLGFLAAVQAKTLFISLEPFLAEVTPPELESSDFVPISWLIMGALTGPKAFQPQPTWVWKMLDWAKKYGIKRFIKNNLGCDGPRIQEWPG